MDLRGALGEGRERIRDRLVHLVLDVDQRGRPPGG